MSVTNGASSEAGRGARTLGFAGCLGSVLAGGAGVVLLGLALQPHTREALPFGAGLLFLGIIAGAVGAVSLRSGFARSDAPGTTGIALGPARPPATVACLAGARGRATVFFPSAEWRAFSLENLQQ